MTHLLILALIVAIYTAKQARDERDALQLELFALRCGHRSSPTEWQQAEDRLAAERRVWQQTAAVHRAARQAMHEAVMPPNVVTPPTPTARVVVCPTRWGPLPRSRGSQPAVPADDDWFARRVP